MAVSPSVAGRAGSLDRPQALPTTAAAAKKRARPIAAGLMQVLSRGRRWDSAGQPIQSTDALMLGRSLPAGHPTLQGGWAATIAACHPDSCDDADIGNLQAALDALPAPLEPLDADGAGRLPVRRDPAAAAGAGGAVAAAWSLDVDGGRRRRAPTPAPSLTLAARAPRRACSRRSMRAHWFDPWVYPLDDERHAAQRRCCPGWPASPPRWTCSRH